MMRNSCVGMFKKNQVSINVSTFFISLVFSLCSVGSYLGKKPRDIVHNLEDICLYTSIIRKKHFPYMDRKYTITEYQMQNELGYSSDIHYLGMIRKVR